MELSNGWAWDDGRMSMRHPVHGWSVTCGWVTTRLGRWALRVDVTEVTHDDAPWLPSAPHDARRLSAVAEIMGRRLWDHPSEEVMSEASKVMGERRVREMIRMASSPSDLHNCQLTN